MKSILQDKKECWLTRQLHGTERTRGLERHHVFGGNPNRKLSEKYGLTVYLTHEYHNEHPNGVHFNPEHSLMLRRYAQRRAMEVYGWSKQDFIHIFGKNYLED